MQTNLCPIRQLKDVALHHGWAENQNCDTAVIDRLCHKYLVVRTFQPTIPPGDVLLLAE